MRIPFLVLLAGCGVSEPAEPPGLVVDVDAMLDHLEVFQVVADEHDGTRSVNGEGYEASVSYVVETLQAAGYEVTLDPFEVEAYYLASALLQAEGEEPLVIGRASDADYRILDGSGNGDVTAKAVPIDVVVPAAPERDTSTSGCEAGDFADFPEGAVALVQRGTCTFDVKVANAEQAGAAGVVLFNEGQEGRTTSFFGGLEEVTPSIPVAALSYGIGAGWVASEPTVHLAVQGEMRRRVQHNVIAETPGGDPDRVVMAGAHLDSVKEGPGINDNASGSALVLQMALEVAASGWEPPNRLRFAWWGAEEIGLVGSWFWVHDEETGEPDAVDDLMAYLNYDMVASGTNGSRGIYPAFGQPAEDGAAEIEALYTEWFDLQDLEAHGFLPPATDFGSDVAWFAQAGVPSGGLFSGIDDCYHKPCDRSSEIDPLLYEEMAGAAFYVLEGLGVRQDDLPDAVGQVAARTTPRPQGPPPMPMCHDHEAHPLEPR